MDILEWNRQCDAAGKSEYCYIFPNDLQAYEDLEITIDEIENRTDVDFYIGKGYLIIKTDKKGRYIGMRWVKEVSFVSRGKSLVCYCDGAVFSEVPYLM